MNNKIKKILRFIFLKLPAWFIIFSVAWVLLLKWVPIFITPLMISRSIEHIDDKSFKTHKHWVSFEKISPEMSRAVIASEDDLFAKHNGFNYDAIKKAWKNNQKGKRLRGGSTISQQTAKNVFCTNSRTWIRKGFETYFTVLIELIWGKKRILEVYLNVIEMGRGIYGVESAAQELFHKPAKLLTRRECCLLAACLPNPMKRNAARPSNYTASRAAFIARLEYNISYPEWIYHKKNTSNKKKVR